MSKGVALVTGGGSGIGRATGVKLAAQGFDVVFADIDIESATQAAAECGGNNVAMHCDVTDPASIAKLFEALGPIAALVNNAGAGGSQQDIANLDIGEWDDTMALLLRSAAICTHHAIRKMEHGGAIVNVASVASFSAGYSPLAYAVAKAGVLQLTKVSAAQLAHRDIRVNAVCPGMILTNIYTNGLDEYPTAAAMVAKQMEATAPNAQPLRKAGLPDHVADSIAYLLSDEAAFVTGTHLVVDGGMLVGPRHSWDPAMWEERRKAREALYAHAIAGGAEE